MNFEKQGFNIAKIRHRERKKGFKSIPIHVEPDFVKARYLSIVDEIKIPDEAIYEQIMQHMPYKNESEGNTRQIAYVSGSSGSGKSYYCAEYIKEYVKMFSKNKVILFSGVNNDKQLDDIKNLIRVKLDDEFANKEISLEDFRDTLVIFDDCEAIENRLVASKLNSLLSMILVQGRHQNIFCLLTTHNTTNAAKTKLILIECHSITLFLQKFAIYFK